MCIPTPITLTIAGSDSSGGAGIQADLKAISATGGYACSVITALTAQNTLGVQAIHDISCEFIEQQLDSVFTDLEVCAVKVGMLANARVIESVAKKLKEYRPRFVVLDPVMVATSGDCLLEPNALESLKNQLIPLASIITPNLAEAFILTGLPANKHSQESKNLIDALATLNSPWVLLKGGHSQDVTQSCDYLIGQDSVDLFSAKRIDTSNTHGTGCTLSAALASYLAQGYSIKKSIALAKTYLTEAIAQADLLKVGAGHGPVHHFHHLPKLR